MNWFIDYLSNRKHRVTFSVVKSYWNSLKAGVPQGSILGALLFLLYINDIVKDIGSNIRPFADDTSLYIIVEDRTLAATLLNFDYEKSSTMGKTCLVSFNPFKTESLLVSRKANKPDHASSFMSEQIIKEVDTHKHLGPFIKRRNVAFLPSAIRDWNSLSEETRNASSVSAFKSRLDRNVIVPDIPKYFYIGER